MATNAKELYQAGQLGDAVAAAAEDVKRHPSNVGPRGFYCELLCFAGQWEKADRQLEAIGQQDPASMVGVSLFRQLVRAEQARQQCYSEGRVPLFLDGPSGRLKLHLEASIHLREGNSPEAARLLAEAEQQRPAPRGTADGRPFDDFRDLDDLTSSFFEVLTSKGTYYWIPMSRVEQIELHPPQRPRDLLWRRAHMIVRGGPDGEVFLPTLYAGSCADEDDGVRLGRRTDWRGGGDAPVRGVGQRSFLVGNEDCSILALKEISFAEGGGEETHEPSPD
jgi:type VI secretion system protein ImpE